MPLTLTDLENELVLSRISHFLHVSPAAITPNDLETVMQSGVSAEYAYALLLFSLCGFDMDQSAHRMLFQTYFLPMVKCLDPELIQKDAYMRLRFPQTRQEGWQYEQCRYAPCEAFVRDDFTLLPSGRLIPAIGFFRQEVFYPAVKQNGRIWMSVTPNEINTMRAPLSRAQGHVLTYGLGLGYFAYHAALKSDVASVTIVDHDADAISLFQRHLLMQFPHSQKITLICDDAFSYAEKHMAKGHFDMVFTDLWHDVEDGIPLYLRMKALEHLLPKAKHEYWIEKSLRCYLTE